jgi:magnesium chelatase family protein
MAVKIFSAATIGLDGYLVEVEAAHASGLRNFCIVGLPDMAVKEARERVSAALKHSGITFPRGRVVVNLAPADLKKQGTWFDLPIALSILCAIGQLEEADTSKSLFVGELALDGAVRPVGSVLLVALVARALGIQTLYVPEKNAPEALLASGLRVISVKSLPQLLFHLRGEGRIGFTKLRKRKQTSAVSFEPDFADVCGQEAVKRALEIAAAGGHNVLMNGSPGAGKTLLARSLPGILPSLAKDEAIEVTKIYSVAGLLPHGSGLLTVRPFRSPHHSTSGVALIGGGTIPRPGEVSLAHRGVLFLDELPEFGRAALENLRQPIEDGRVTIARAAQTIQFPSKFMFVAAMNPCACGYAGSQGHMCVCTPTQMTQYRKKISGPLLDRMDLYLTVPKVPVEKLTTDEPRESSAAVRARVEAARERQAGRLRAFHLHTNSEMGEMLVKKICVLNEDGQSFLRSAMKKFNLSARAYARVRKVARTIADLAGSANIRSADVAEALQYRPIFETAP